MTALMPSWARSWLRWGCTEVCITVDDSIDAVVGKIMAALGLPA